MNRNIFNVYASDEVHMAIDQYMVVKYQYAIDDVHEISYINHDIPALRPIVITMDYMHEKGMITEDIHNTYRIFIVNSIDIADTYDVEDLVNLLRGGLEDLSRDVEFNDKYIIILRYKVPEGTSYPDVRNIINHPSLDKFGFYIQEEDDIDSEEAEDELLFIYLNNIGKKINDCIMTAQSVNSASNKGDNMSNNYNIKYYLSYFAGSSSIRTIIVNLNTYITTTEDLDKLKNSIAESDNIDPRDITIIAFSLMGSPAANKDIKVMPSNQMMYVFKITYSVNGEEDELVQGVDVDILDDQYKDLDLPMSLVRDLDGITDEDEIEIIDVERIGYGDAGSMVDQYS